MIYKYNIFIVSILLLILILILYIYNINIKKEKFDNNKYLLQPLQIYDNFINNNECKYLINISKGLFQDSEIYDTTALVNKNLRSSKNSSFQRSENLIITSIENKIINLLNIEREQLEPIQIVKYEKGNMYKPHYDYFAKHSDNINNQRLYTFIIYLNDLDEKDGGATYFPKYGIRIFPKQGRCICFRNANDKGYINDMSLHTGEEIITDTVKYILTVWVRQYSY